jgi:hypothetical protein
MEGVCYWNVFLRFFARCKVVGIGGLACDDLFSFIAMVCHPHLSSNLNTDVRQLLFTADSASVQIINTYKPSRIPHSASNQHVLQMTTVLSWG